MRVCYRARQFWHAIHAAPNAEELSLAQQALSPSLMALFLQMQPVDQAHSINILKELRQQGEVDADLMAAALLHDAGKSQYPLGLWERVLIVLAKKFFPQQTQRWSIGDPTGWRRTFVVAENHPVWGADMAAEAGASALTVSLIRRHQQDLPPLEKTTGNESEEDRLLMQLRAVDDNS